MASKNIETTTTDKGPLEKASDNNNLNGEILDELKAMPEEKQKIITQETFSKAYRGPLSKNKKTCFQVQQIEYLRWLKNRLFTGKIMKKKQLEWGHSLNEKLVNPESFNTTLGLVFGFILALLFIKRICSHW